ncbi:MAG: 50S ribosomal protein L13 [Candidatus Omnitrophica bacterium]|nr:50S ribosomal protein L13 [Candidatus Omnitrophota bacterium]
MKILTIPRKSEIKRKWYLLDAKGKILGKVAVKAATLLRGKHKPTFTPYMDTGDCVVVINAADIKVTGAKMEQKLYRRHSGYPGGLREVPLGKMLAARPEQVMRLAVKRMLPTSALSRCMLRRLKIYAGEQGYSKSLKPTSLEV